MIVEPAPEGGVNHFGVTAWNKLCAFADLLESDGELRGLVGPRELERLWTRHILNSTAVASFLPRSGVVADIGSGAGFPGIVLAILRPDLKFDLVDSMVRRTEWLEYCSEALELTNVTVIRNRAENLPRKYKVEAVTCRAVAALKKLLPWTLPYLKSGGSLLALKGQRAEQEIEEAADSLFDYGAAWADVYDVEVWGTPEGTRVLEVRK